jgi:hypothetical protein
MMTEVMSGPQPYEIKIGTKCNTARKHIRQQLNQITVEVCYAYSSILRKAQ